MVACAVLCRPHHAPSAALGAVPPQQRPGHIQAPGQDERGGTRVPGALTRGGGLGTALLALQHSASWLPAHSDSLASVSMLQLHVHVKVCQQQHRTHSHGLVTGLRDPHEPWLVPRFGIPSHNYCTVL